VDSATGVGDTGTPPTDTGDTGVGRTLSAAIVPTSPRAAESLRCDVVLAADTDASSVVIAWTLDGVSWTGATSAADYPGDTIPAGHTQVDDQWRCTASASAPSGPQLAENLVLIAPWGGNILILIADDIGTDKVGFTGEHPDAPPTPRLDTLAAAGTIFDNAYGNPTCSPTRATLLTGRYGRRYGIGEVIHLRDTFELPLTEITIAEMLDYSRHFHYSNGFVGKWHVAGENTPTNELHPYNQGWTWWTGTLANIEDYNDWEKMGAGTRTWRDVYATTDTVDDALWLIDTLKDEPWVIGVSFHAAHDPFHMPPDHLHTQDPSATDTLTLHNAMIEAMDTEIGRLIDSMDPAELDQTTILFVGDNGTDSEVVLPPLDPAMAKGTLFEGGIGIPMFITGPPVANPGSRSSALVHTVDVFATVADLAGVHVEELEHFGIPIEIDGRSLVPQLADPGLSGREMLYSEQFSPLGPPPYDVNGTVVRDGRYKLYNKGVKTYFFDLQGRHDDGPDLLQQGLSTAEQAVFDALWAETERLRSTLGYEH